MPVRIIRTNHRGTEGTEKNHREMPKMACSWLSLCPLCLLWFVSLVPQPPRLYDSDRILGPRRPSATGNSPPTSPGGPLARYVVRRPLVFALRDILGAARAVTGSMHLVAAAGKHILLDCGMVRGSHAEAFAPGFPFDPRTVDAVVLTHAHIDHCGSLPALVRHGFEGPIFCTAATRDLTAVMLADSARIQEERSVLAYATQRRALRDTPFTGTDVDRVIDQCVPLAYEQPTAIGDVEFRLVDAGHLLGSAMVTLTAGRSATLTYTGDLGRRDLPLHGPPAAIPPADLLLCESTYGGRYHDPVPGTTERLAQIVRETIGRHGRVLIPAFSLGRTQLVLHALQTVLCGRDSRRGHFRR